MHTVEVVARFETTVLDTRVLDRGASYRIGTAPGVDLPVELEPSVAVVEDDLVRIPPGATATLNGRPISCELRLGRHDRIELRIGRVAIAIRWTARPDTVPRGRIDRRRYAYVAASLGAHLLLFVLAVQLAPFREPPAPPPRPIHVARFPEAAPAPREAPSPVPAIATTPAEPSVAPPPAEKVADATRSPRARAIARAREAGILGADGLTDLRAFATSDPAKAFKGVRPAYREEEANARQFGGGESWDPGGVIPMGRFQTRSNAGADYELAGATPAVKTAVDVAGEISGPLSRDKVIAIVKAHTEDVIDCQDRHAGPRARGIISLTFDIDRDGTVLRPTADGMGEVGGCVMRVVQAIGFPTAPGDAQTEVKLSIELRDQ